MPSHIPNYMKPTQASQGCAVRNRITGMNPQGLSGYTNRVSQQRYQQGSSIGGNNNHCIIQWYKQGGQRRQDNFKSNNPASHSLTDRSLIPNKKKFHGTSPVNCQSNVYNASSNRIKINHKPEIKINTKDIFLYGHSTWRVDPGATFGKKKGGLLKSSWQSRGASVGGRYVSASKFATYLNEIAHPNLKGANVPKRIWLMSCYTSHDDLGKNRAPKVYSESFTKKLKEFGWKNTEVIGFDYGITTKTLGICRQFAANTKPGSQTVVEMENSLNPKLRGNCKVLKIPKV